MVSVPHVKQAFLRKYAPEMLAFIPMAGQGGRLFDIIHWVMVKKGGRKSHKEAMACCEVSRGRPIRGHLSSLLLQINDD